MAVYWLASLGQPPRTRTARHDIETVLRDHHEVDFQLAPSLSRFRRWIIPDDRDGELDAVQSKPGISHFRWCEIAVTPHQVISPPSHPSTYPGSVDQSPWWIHAPFGA